MKSPVRKILSKLDSCEADVRLGTLAFKLTDANLNDFREMFGRIKR